MTVDILTTQIFLGLDLLTIIFAVAIGIPVLVIAFMIWLDLKNAKKSVVLYFISEKQAELIDKEVNNGLITIGKRSIAVDTEKPLLLKAQGVFLKSFRPFHIIKHDRALPHHFTDKGVKIITGENLKSLIENKTLDKLLQPKGADKMQILFLILGIVIGAIMGYFIAGALAQAV